VNASWTPAPLPPPKTLRRNNTALLRRCWRDQHLVADAYAATNDAPQNRYARRTGAITLCLTHYLGAGRLSFHCAAAAFPLSTFAAVLNDSGYLTLRRGLYACTIPFLDGREQTQDVGTTWRPPPNAPLHKTLFISGFVNGIHPPLPLKKPLFCHNNTVTY